MNINQILASKDKGLHPATAEDTLRNAQVAQTDNAPITDVEKCLLTNLLCKYKGFKMRLEKTSEAGWSKERQYNEVVLKYFTEVEELLEDFTKQG